MLKWTIGISFIVVLLFDAFLYRNPNHATVLNYLFNLIYASVFFIGSLTGFIKSRKFDRQPNMRMSLIFFGIGLLFYTLGLIIWTYYNLILKIEIPYPSLADISFLLYYPGVFLATYFLIKSLGSRVTGKMITEGALIFLFLFGIIYLFLNQTSLGPDVTFWAQFLNTVYPLFDALLVAFAITVLRTEKGVSQHPNILYFVFGFLILATADTIFSYRSAMGSYWNGDVSDLLFALSGFLTSWGLISIKVPSLTDHSLS